VSHSNDYIKPLLESGADGMLIQMVNTPEDIKRLINDLKYPPVGSRSYGVSRAQGYGFDFENYRDFKAKDIKLIVQIEHINAINELDEILKIEGVDGTFIGPYDLSGSLGKPGQWDEPEVVEALKVYEETVKKYDKWVGFHVVPPDYKLVLEKKEKGYNFVAFSFDAYFLGQTIREQLKHLK
jgi:2-dehydro-3-deoxyglucarate aldolase